MLELKDINMTFRSGLINHSVTKVLSDVNLNIERGKVFGLIGNSGSGKTTLAKIAVRLIDPTSGRIIIDGDDITMLNFSKMRAYRSRLQMVFQHPETAVNPEMKLGASLKEALVKSGVSRDRMKDTITETCNIMGISESILSRYPTQVSGGEIQRVALARVLAFEPDYLFLDEPTSMLDASVQATIVSILREHYRSKNMGVIFITHDLDLAREVCDDIAVIDGGKVIENGPTDTVLSESKNEYIRNYVETWDSFRTTDYWL